MAGFRFSVLAGSGQADLNGIGNSWFKMHSPKRVQKEKSHYKFERRLNADANCENDGSHSE